MALHLIAVVHVPRKGMDFMAVGVGKKTLQGLIPVESEEDSLKARH